MAGPNTILRSWESETGYTEFSPSSAVLRLLRSVPQPDPCEMSRTITVSFVSTRILWPTLRFAYEIVRQRHRAQRSVANVSLVADTPPQWQREFIRCHLELRGLDRIHMFMIAAGVLGFDELISACRWGMGYAETTERLLGQPATKPPLAAIPIEIALATLGEQPASKRLSGCPRHGERRRIPRSNSCPT